MIFQDRREAGRRLAAQLRDLAGGQVVVLALPRGGVPVAYEVAHALRAPMDLVLARKIGAPGNREFAIGAVAEGGEMMTDADSLSETGADEAWLEAERAAALAEIARRRRVYLGDRPAIPRCGKVAIVVDDGIATGATMEVALRAVRARNPERVIMAVPVAAPQAMARLRPLADTGVCLHIPPRLRAVGAHYRDFAQTEDAEVIALLAANAAEISPRR